MPKDADASRAPLLRSVVVASLFCSAPLWPEAIGGQPEAAVGLCVEALILVVLLPWMSRWARWGAAAVWACFVSYGLVLAASRIAADAELPLSDLGLLVRPLVVVASDLYGPVAYGALLLAGLVPLALAGLGAWWLRALASRPLPNVALGAMALGLLLPGSSSVAGALAADLMVSVRMASAFRQEVARRDTESLRERVARQRPDVQIVIVESYGMVTATLPSAGAWRGTLRELGEASRAQGWHTVSGQSVAPVHGSRSWIADASMFTGLQVSHQADYERVVRRLDGRVTMPGWFAEQGWSTLLVRPTDRARPGVQLINHFGFQHTVFFEDLGYTGPSVGWGYVPDQFTLHRVQRDVLPELPPPRFAFVHLATSHVPWQRTPPLLDDPLDWQARGGPRGWKAEAPSPWKSLRMVARRFRPSQRDPADIAAIQHTYVETVSYCLRSVVATLPEPADAGTVLIVLGDHQPPFLAPDQGHEVPVHVLASDPALLEPFRQRGFVDGWVPGAGTMAHHDFLPLLVGLVSEPRGTAP